MNALKLTATLVVLAVLPAFGEDLVLKPGDVEIVADAAQSPLAVRELKTLLGEAFDAEVPVVTAPSGTRKTLTLEIDPSFARDDIRLVTDDKGVRIVNGAAKVYGVYEFLERYAGMRFYFPGPLGTIVPKRTELAVPFGTVDVKPDYTQRSCDMSWGLNGPWYSLKHDGEADKKEAGELRALAAARMRLAPRLMCCHGLAMDFNLLKRHGKDHPEYFALMKAPDGTLYRDNSADSKWGGHHGQLCHTSGVWDEIYKETARRLQAGEASVDVMAQDGMQKCLCEKCQTAYSKDPDDRQWATDLIWGRTIELANRLSAAGIKGDITQMAYSPYNRIPDMKFPPNVLVMVAQNGAWSMANAERIARENGQIRAWAEKMGHKVWIWNYTGKFGHKIKNPDIPPMTPRAIGKYYASLSDAIFGSYMESRTDRWIYNYLNYYVYNKVSWDTKVDVDALLDEHFQLMFGAAASEMKTYYGRLEELWMTRICNNVVETNLGPVIREPTPYQKWVEIYSPAVMDEFEDCFRKAAKKIARDSLEFRRLGFVYKHFQKPLKAASDAYLDKVDAMRNEAKRAARENRSILKGTRADAAEPLAFDGQVSNGRMHRQSLKGLLKPNTTYRVSYFVKMENLVSTGYNGGANLRFFDGKNGPLHPIPAERVGTRDWVHQEFDQKTGPDIGADAYIRFGVDSATGKAWFKGVRIEEVEAE